MARKWSIMSFLQKCVPHLPFRHIEPILLVPQQSISQMEAGLGSIWDVLPCFVLAGGISGLPRESLEREKPFGCQPREESQSIL